MEIIYDSLISNNIEFEEYFMNNKTIPKKVKDFVMNYLVDRIVYYKNGKDKFIYLLYNNERKEKTLKIKR